MKTATECTIPKPPALPFLNALCWDLRDIHLLTEDEILNRYERGWKYKDVLAAIPAHELRYISELAKAKGSWLQARV